MRVKSLNRDRQRPVMAQNFTSLGERSVSARPEKLPAIKWARLYVDGGKGLRRLPGAAEKRAPARNYDLLSVF